MFYRGIPIAPPIWSSRGQTAAQVVLTPSESKRLIAKAVAALPEIQKALKTGYVIISRGTTNAFVAEEILKMSIDKLRYAAGIITQGKLGVSPRDKQLRPYVLHQGQPVEALPEKALESFGAEDVFIKGANAVDPQGNAGVLVAGAQGGTIGTALMALQARGSHLFIPVGLEKLVPSVLEVAPRYGISRFKYNMGMVTGVIPVVSGQVVTEVQALNILAGVSASHLASGGIGGSEGSVVLAFEGDEAAVEKAWALVQSIKGEPPVAGPA